MKKMLKKISTIVLAFIVTLSNLVGVKAFDSSIEINDDDIYLPKSVSSSYDNYISLWGDLKNDSAIVSSQFIILTKDQFETIDKKATSIEAYYNEQEAIITEKKQTLDKEEEEVEKLEEIANKEGATQEQKDAYDAALTKYNANLAAAQQYKEDVNKQIEQYNIEFEKLVPSFNDNNWTRLTISEKEEYLNRYNIGKSNNENYKVLWIKVTLNGKDYYNYGLYCAKEEIKYYCEINDGKYYNSEGKEVTEAEYKADCEVEEKKYCEIVNGKYYNKQGEEVTEAEYKAACEEKKICKIENGKYYNKQGKEVTEAEYKADCEEKKICEIVNGKYYNSKGKEVTKEEYKADCEKVVINVCKIVDGKYYDNNGKEVSKKEYEKACTVPSNPKTGLNNNILYGVLITLVAGSSYIVVRKTKKFSR